MSNTYSHSLLREKKMAGQEGLEPPASGFGDRRSTIRATGLLYKLAGLFVQSVGFAPLAVLLVLNTLWVELLVLLSSVVATLAFSASQRHQCPHCSSFGYLGERGSDQHNVMIRPRSFVSVP